MHDVAEPDPPHAGLLPSRPEVDVPDQEIEILAIDEAGTVLEVLSSETARAILAAIYEDVGPTAEIANRVDTSIQNAAYHLSRLEDVGLAAVVGTWYSSKGSPMDVYGPTVDPLVLIAGSAEQPAAEVIGRPVVEDRTG